jgi:hypothetical protein
MGDDKSRMARITELSRFCALVITETGSAADFGQQNTLQYVVSKI